jgi:hypothetical protein
MTHRLPGRACAAVLALWALGCSGKTEPDDASGDPSDTDTDEPGDSGDSGSPGPAIAWSPVVSDDARGAWLSVWGSAADDVWIVGGQPESGVVLRGSGSDFTEVVLPREVPILNWVHGTGADDVWIGGVSGTLLHWDGSDWTDHSLGVEEAVWGVFAVAPDDVYAVGGESAWGGETALARHYDGTSWSEVVVPDELSAPSNLFKVHAVSPTEVWAIGVGGVAMVGSGTSFAPAPTGVAADLVTANASHGPLVVVGGRGTGVIMEADGAGGLASSVQAGAGLNGVMVYPSGVAVVVGELGYSGLFDLETDELTDVLGSSNDVLHATWGVPGGTMYAVGGNLYTTADSFEGIVLTAEAPE